MSSWEQALHELLAESSAAVRCASQHPGIGCKSGRDRIHQLPIGPNEVLVQIEHPDFIINLIIRQSREITP